MRKILSISYSFFIFLITFNFLFAEDLSGHPPAVVITAGFDPLRDEGDKYAQALRQANVEIYHRTHDSYIHGFVNMMVVNGVDYALKRICDDFKKIF